MDWPLFIVLLTSDYVKCLQQLMVLHSRAASGRHASFSCNSCTHSSRSIWGRHPLLLPTFIFLCSRVLLNKGTKYKHLAFLYKFQPVPATKITYPQFFSFHTTSQLFRSCLPSRAAHCCRGVLKAASCSWGKSRIWSLLLWAQLSHPFPSSLCTDLQVRKISNC